MPLDTDNERLDLTMAQFLEQMNIALGNGKIVGAIAERDKIADWLEEVSLHPTKPSFAWLIDRIRHGVDG
jgi:hypothetical protein